MAWGTVIVSTKKTCREDLTSYSVPDEKSSLSTVVSGTDTNADSVECLSLDSIIGVPKSQGIVSVTLAPSNDCVAWTGTFSFFGSASYTTTHSLAGYKLS
jgi:hypothetical protein